MDRIIITNKHRRTNFALCGATIKPPLTPCAYGRRILYRKCTGMTCSPTSRPSPMRYANSATLSCKSWRCEKPGLGSDRLSPLHFAP